MMILKLIFIVFVLNGGDCGIMVTVLGNGHGDPSSNPTQGCFDAY